jgi:hypothetical protein
MGVECALLVMLTLFIVRAERAVAEPLVVTSKTTSKQKWLQEMKPDDCVELLTIKDSVC